MGTHTESPQPTLETTMIDCPCGMILDEHEEECPNCHRENVDGEMTWMFLDYENLSDAPDWLAIDEDS